MGQTLGYTKQSSEYQQKFAEKRLADESLRKNIWESIQWNWHIRQSFLIVPEQSLADFSGTGESRRIRTKKRVKTFELGKFGIKQSRD